MPGSTYGQHQPRKGGKEDERAKANGGRFDEHLPPSTDPVTGKEDLPDEQEFKEAIAKAAAAAKAMGKMPAGFQRMVDEILQPQVNWREHVRMLLTGRLGARHETWNRPNRRRLVLNPIVILPGRRGFGAEDVVCVVDTSGSTGQKELDSFFAEVGGVLQDVRPKRIHVVWCDAAVAGVDVVSSLDELGAVRANPKGGGGTDFRPPFEWVREQGLKPETLIYLTDGYGSFPDDPGYPTVWCMTTDVEPPFGDTVRIEV
jgi:predicted metal-dependent peptidase